MNKPDWMVRQADWKEDQLSIKSVREIIFIQEQSVPEALEWDDHDKAAKHLLALDKKNIAIGTARLLQFGDQGQIGRMAVLKEHRGNGIGTALLKEALRLAKEEKLSSVFLNAQVQVISFYRSFGFSLVGNEFSEAGIPHQKMVTRLLE
jgi:predicted GNAT family N-acyltransferase